MARRPPPSGYSSWPAYWTYKKSVARQYGPTPGGIYTIDIPGLKDIFKYQLKGSYSKQYKYELYMRMKTQASPVPQALNWIPGVITQLDDAQDLAYTALVLAKPLLRRLPSRFIPFIGWALLAMDLINLLTKLLGLAMTPGLSKPCLRKQIAKAKRLKKLPLEIFRDFIGPGGWRKKLAFALQAPQAMVTLTGYGLQLGTIMGATSNLIWGGIKAAMGEAFVFRAPPPSDPLGKAFRFVSQTYNACQMRDILTADEHVLMLLAQNVALGLILDSGTTFNDQRSNELMSERVAVFEPWELSTLEILEEVGHPLDEEIVPYTNIQKPTYDQIIDDNMANWPAWERAMRDVFDEFSEEYSSMLYLIYRETADDLIELATGVSLDLYTEDTDGAKAVYEMAACDLMPLYPPSEDQIVKLLDLAYTLAESRGAAYPQCQDFKKGIEELFTQAISKSKREATPPTGPSPIP